MEFLEIPTKIPWNLTSWSKFTRKCKKSKNNQGSPEDEEQVGRGNDLPYPELKQLIKKL